jgi:MFS family permease
MKLPLLLISSTFTNSFLTSYSFMQLKSCFLLDRGLDLSQIGILLFMWSIMSLLLEVPTGIIADHWSRRKMLILSGVFFSLCYTFWIFSHSFVIFLLGYFFRTLGSTFASGTLQAYVYDFLKLYHKEDQFEKIWGRGNALRTLGIGIAVGLGGFLAEKSFNLPVMLSAISILSLSVIAFFWPEIKPFSKTGEEGYWKFLTSSVKAVGKNPKLVHIVLYSAIVLSVFANLEEFNDVYLQFLGFPLGVIGIIFTVATIGQSIASLLAHKLKHHPWHTLNAIAFIGFIILILASLVKAPVMAAGILILGILLELSNVLNQGIIQNEVPQNQRATIASLTSFVGNILPFQMVFGIIASRSSLQLGYLCLALCIIPYFVYIAIYRNRS